MQENPFSGIVSMMKATASEASRPAWRIGKVVSNPPLVVSIGGVPMPGEALLVNEQLLDHGRHVELSGLVGELAGDPGTTVIGGALQADARVNGPLTPGDQVVLLQNEADQQWIILCKVVGGG